MPEEIDKACSDGDLVKLKSIIEENNINIFNAYFLNAVKVAVYNNHPHIVQYIFEERLSKYSVHQWHANQAFNLDASFEKSAKRSVFSYALDTFRDLAQGICTKNHLATLKVFMDILDGFPRDNDFEVCMRDACREGHLDMVKYMLTLPGADNYIFYQKHYNKILSGTEPQANIVTQYFLASPELSKHVKPLKLLREAHQDDNSELIDYIIFEHNLPYSNKVKKEVCNLTYGSRNIPELFEKREKIIKFAQQLQEDLPLQEKAVPRLKI